MPAAPVVIRRESLPVRCDMCHQADQFDPETGNCLRCAGIDPELVATQTRTLSEKERAAFFRRLNAQIEYERRRQGVRDCFSFFEMPTALLARILLYLLVILLLLLPVWLAHRPVKYKFRSAVILTRFEIP